MYGTGYIRDETYEKPNRMVWHPRILQERKAMNTPGLERIQGGGGVTRADELGLLLGRRNPAEAPWWEPKPQREGLSDYSWNHGRDAAAVKGAA